MTTTLEHTILRFDDPLGNPVTVEYMLVTPGIARDWLARNIEHNRALNNVNLERLQMDLRDGLFQFNGDTIRFDYRDQLIDGQHRLKAIANTGIAAWMLVVRGIEPEAMPTIDQTKDRSVNDILQITGRPIKDASAVVATAQIFVSSDQSLRSIHHNRSRIADFVWENYDEIRPWLLWVKRALSHATGFNVSQNHPSGRGRQKPAASTTALTALCITMARHGANPTHVETFWEAVLTGVCPDVSLYDTAVAMRRYLIETNPLIREGGTQLPMLLRNYDTIIRVYNKWRLGTPVRTVKAAGFNEGIRWMRDVVKAVDR